MALPDAEGATIVKTHKVWVPIKDNPEVSNHLRNIEFVIFLHFQLFLHFQSFLHFFRFWYIFFHSDYSVVIDIFFTCQSRNYLLTCASAEMCNGRLRLEWVSWKKKWFFVFWSCETIVKIWNFSLYGQNTFTDKKTYTDVVMKILINWCDMRLGNELVDASLV